MWDACKLTYLDSKLAQLLVLGLMQIKWSFSLLFVLVEKLSVSESFK